MMIKMAKVMTMMTTHNVDDNVCKEDYNDVNGNFDKGNENKDNDDDNDTKHLNYTNIADENGDNDGKNNDEDNDGKDYGINNNNNNYEYGQR